MCIALNSNLFIMDDVGMMFREFWELLTTQITWNEQKFTALYACYDPSKMRKRYAINSTRCRNRQKHQHQLSSIHKSKNEHKNVNNKMENMTWVLYTDYMNNPDKILHGIATT